MTRPRPPEPREHVLLDGPTGREITLEEFVRAATRADVVAFGELHGHPVGATYQLDLLRAMGARGRPVALALEFLERDMQEALDAYLAGDIDAETFRKEARRPKVWDVTHGPLVDWAKRNGAPVIAANAPRRLVSGYRKFEGGEDFAAYRASLTEEERNWLPADTSTLDDAYWERFRKLMGEKMAGPFFRSQSLWDDAMADSIARFRDSHPSHRVLFIVGGFHVTDGLGTITKYRLRRPGDTVALLLMDADDDPTLAFQDEDRMAAGALLKVRPPKREASTGPNPHARPKKDAPKPPEPSAHPQP